MDARQQSMLDALMGSLAISSSTPDGRTLLSVHPLRPARDAGDWPAEPVARAAAAALAAALAEAGAPALLEGCVEELQDVVSSDDEYSVSARRVHATDGFSHPPGSAASALGELETFDGGNETPPAVLLTHTFSLPVGDATQRLRLSTLVLPEGQPARELLATVFGACAHVALSSKEDRNVYTDVTLGDAASLSTDELAALPSATRDAVRAALRAQRLSATAACIEAKWVGGFCALQLGVAAMQPALAPPLAALATRLASGAGPTRASLKARELEAEALEVDGRYLEAAALYKQNIMEDARNPAARLLLTPPLQWSHYGLALKRAGRFREAKAAYAAGLRALETGPVEPDTPEWRETNRLNLLGFNITLGQAMHDQAFIQVAIAQIFGPQLELFKAMGENVQFGGPGFSDPSISGTKSGRCFSVVKREGRDHVHRGLQLSSVEELPRRAASSHIPSLSQQTHQLTAEAAARQRKEARKQLSMRHNAAPPPKLPQARCALCAEPAAKRCSACGGPAYCGADCQKQDWKNHKPACMAARTAAAV